MLMAVGARPIWRANGRFVLIGPAGEHWDEIILVAYPSRAAFDRLLNLPGFQARAGLRAAALQDSRLMLCGALATISRESSSAAALRPARSRNPGRFTSRSRAARDG